MLIECFECHQGVSTEAGTCPHCGSPVKAYPVIKELRVWGLRWSEAKAVKVYSSTSLLAEVPAFGCQTICNVPLGATLRLVDGKHEIKCQATAEHIMTKFNGFGGALNGVVLTDFPEDPDYLPPLKSIRPEALDFGPDGPPPAEEPVKKEPAPVARACPDCGVAFVGSSFKTCPQCGRDLVCVSGGEPASEGMTREDELAQREKLKEARRKELREKELAKEQRSASLAKVWGVLGILGGILGLIIGVVILVSGSRLMFKAAGVVLVSLWMIVSGIGKVLGAD